MNTKRPRMGPGEDFSLRQFWTPRYWPTWILLASMVLIEKLPFPTQRRIGEALGSALTRIKRRDRRYARRNLELCFPELRDDERSALLDRHFRSLGLSMVEMANGWFSPIDKLRKLVEVRGLEHLNAALARGSGALVVCAHFTPVEIAVAILEDYPGRVSCMYRPQRNAMMDVMIRRGRRRFANTQIPRDNVRTLIKCLRDNHAVLYMPDQTHLGKQSALIPFFGVPAMTNIATTRLAEISGAPVLPYFFRRKDDDSGYLVEIGPPFEDFPSGDPIDDTLRLVQRLEDDIRRVPDQYLWMYKKFKGRPASLPNVYG